MEAVQSIVAPELLDASPHEEFEYGKTALGPDEIRILILRSEFYEEDASDVHCHLVRLDLNATKTLSRKRHPFMALSYVWGAEEPKKKIYINGKHKHVSPNLHNALIHLREKMAPVPLWVDALCINQQDPLETSREVLKMKRIYAQCWSVLYWLGPAMDPDLDDFYYGQDDIPAHAVHMQEIGEVYETLRERGDNESEKIIDVWRSVTRVKQIDSLKRLATYLALIFSLPFWRRVWITQEFILSRDGFFVWGKYTFNVGALDALLHPQARLLPYTPYSVDFHRYIKAYSMALETIRMRSYNARFLDALLNVRYRLAGREHDYIYGLLGFTNVRGGIIPDYSKTKRQVFTEAMQAVLAQETNLDILSACDRGWAKCSATDSTTDDQDWPTWLPDWSYAPLKIYQEWRFDVRSLLLDFQDHLPVHFNAGANTRQAAYVLPGGRHLCVRGIGFDSVAEIISGTGVRWEYKVKALWYAGKFRRAYTTLGMLKNACMRTARYGRNNTLPAEPFDQRLQEVFESEETDELDMLAAPNTTHPEPFNDRNDEPGEEKDLSASDGVLFRIHDSASSVFITRRGYLGRSPMTAKIGDKICIFHGGNVPFLLRQQEGVADIFELAGEAYIHGIMTGVAIRARESHWKDFTLA